LRLLPLACFLFLLVFQASPAFAGLTLCIGESGHMEIEVEDAGCCPSKTRSESGPAYALAEEDCESCIDVCLGNHEPDAWAKPGAPGYQGFPLRASVLERLDPLPSTPILPHQGLPIEPSLAALRSIVLRI